MAQLWIAKELEKHGITVNAYAAGERKYQRKITNVDHVIEL
jgi:hypothetical protein